MNILDRLYPYQKEAATSTFFNPKGIVSIPTGLGKCLAKGTKILMYDGRIKVVEEIEVGDIIMGDDSLPRRILSLARGSEMMYDITPKKGEKYRVNESHILSLKVTNIGKDRLSVLDKKYITGNIVDISVKDYLGLSKTAKHVLKGFRVGVKFNGGEKLIIPPRLLGLWLSDGTRSKQDITVNNDDLETIKYLGEQANLMGLNLTSFRNNTGSNCITYSITTKKRGNGGVGTSYFLNMLREKGLINNKHIPHEYKVSSEKDRLELLGGILDGDGCYTGGCFEITLKEEGLIDDIMFIVRSLGLACYKKEKIGKIRSSNFEGKYYRICIHGNIEIIPTLVLRKQASKRLQKKDVLVTGITVTPIGIGDYYGFAIDGNRRFLLGDFTVTHNTYIEASILGNDIIMNPNQFRMYVINAPRIMLTYQLLSEVYSYLVSYGIEARYMFVHSGGKTDESELEDMRIRANVDGHDIPFSEIGSGTSIESIGLMMEKAKSQDLPLIMFSTYNSADRIEIARRSFSKQPISIIMNDEAHYLVQEQFHDILHTLVSSRCYFFTATMINTPSDTGRGMNNSELYGNVLYSMIPREAIDLGKMVRPRLHIVRTDGVYTIDDYTKSISKIIYESFHQHGKVIGTKLSPKILVSVKGTLDIKRFLVSREYQRLREEGVSVFAVASHEDIGNDVNGVKVRRQEFLKQLKIEGNDKTKKMVILHFDVLSEGVDVSGITGILPLRTLAKSKFLQTFGRSARMDKEDRINIEGGLVLPNELDKLNKPYAYIIIPNVIHDNEDDKANLTQVISELRSYGFKPSEDIISSSMVNGIPEIEELGSLNEIRNRLPNVGALIENLEAEIESEVNANLSSKDFLLKHLGI